MVVLHSACVVSPAVEECARLRRFVPLGMAHGAISGFVLMIVSAVGTWAVYGRPLGHTSQPISLTCHIMQLCGRYLSMDS